jgi:hypothetical protein
VKNFLKYFGFFCLGIIAASLAATAVIIYQGISSMRNALGGMDDYTCNQFLYDMTADGTNKMVPLLFASIAYGDAVGADKTRAEFTANGIEPSVRKAAALCQANPKQKLLDAFASSIVKAPASVSPSSPVSGTVSQ